MEPSSTASVTVSESEFVTCPGCDGHSWRRPRCAFCDGSGEVFRYLWLLATEASFQSDADDVVVESDGCVRQGGEGTTGAAAAFLAMRDRFLASGTRVQATRFRQGVHRSPAVELVAPDGYRLRLTGVTWGYPGEGPRALAAILVSLGAFDDLADAFQWVRSRSRTDASWTIGI